MSLGHRMFAAAYDPIMRLVEAAGFTITHLETHLPKRSGPEKPFRSGVAA